MVDATPHLAAIRFGLGPRLDEPLPADPLGWLAAQAAAQLGAAPPAGPGIAEALRARSQDLDDRAAGTTTPGRTRAAEITRAELIGWSRRRLASPEPYRDRLVDFWMNHFTVSRRNGALHPLVGAFEREAIRPHVTSRFADMLVAATLHPAMLIYLNNDSSVGPHSAFGRRSGRGLNENLAREVLELHTLSPAGGYTQGDVTEFAKVLTGWSVAQRTEPFGTVFRPQAHEPGAKQVLGRAWQEGAQEAEAVLRFLAAQPATYRHLAVKLARHFVADDPPPAAVRRIEGVLRDTDGDLGAVARALPLLEEAWATPLSKLRAPQDYTVAVARALALPDERADGIAGAMGLLAQPLWSAPQPNGWPDIAAEWAAPEALLRRLDWANTVAGRATRHAARDVAEAALGPLARAETVAAIAQAGSARDAITLVLASPEFMRR